MANDIASFNKQIGALIERQIATAPIYSKGIQ